MPRYAIIEAPSALGLVPGGVERLPDALLDAGLARALDARRAARVAPPAYERTRDPASGLLNGPGLRDYSAALGDEVGRVLDGGEVPLVLGGDCSVLLGCLLALRRRGGRHGLLFLDGHSDFYQPEAEPNGEVASMELALATGRGPSVLANLEGRSPLVRDEDVVALGRRDAAEAEAAGSQRIEETGVTLIGLERVRSIGAHAACREAIERLTQRELEGFWVHLDCDVLDDAVMPAVDYRLPGGLGWEELEMTLRAAMASGKIAGLDVTIYNPALDPDGAIARALVDVLARALR